MRRSSVEQCKAEKSYRFKWHTRVKLAIAATVVALTSTPALAEYQVVKSCYYDNWGSCNLGTCVTHRGPLVCSTSVVYMADDVPFWDRPGRGENGPGGGGGGSPTDCNSATSVRVSSTPQVETVKGNPIDLASGMKVETDVEFTSAGQIPLSLSRKYVSFNTSNGLFGRYWESNFDYALVVDSPYVRVRMPDMGTFEFEPDVLPNTWHSTTPGMSAVIALQSDGSYLLTWDGSSVQRYSAAGKVLSVKNAQSVGYDYSYNGSGYLYRVTASGGRYVEFTWTGSQLTSVRDPEGNIYQYTYTANAFGTNIHRLATVKFPGATSASITYHYENPTWSGALTGKTFGTQRVSWFGYNAQGLATSTEHRVGTTPIEKYSFSYTQPDATTLLVNETNPLGKQAQYRFLSGRLESVTGVASVSCPASLFQRSFDPNGYPNIVTDFNDKQVDVDYDPQGRLLKEVLGYGSANPTTITYLWDTANNRLTTRTVVGDHSETYSYDSLGRVQSKTFQNLSSNGVANQTRTETYSYGAPFPGGFPSSVTFDGPLPGNGDSITKTYNASGDLISISTPLQTLATYSLYNGFGKPGRIVSDGITFDYQYDNRGRLTSITKTVGGVAVSTVKTYDIQGRVSSETLPDGTTRNYTYDAAGRLTGTSIPEDIEDPNPDGWSETLESKWYYTYDANSDVIKAQVNRKYSFEYFDEELGRTVRGATTTGDVTSFTDYDELGRVKAARGNQGQNFRIGYDVSGFQMSLQDSNGAAVTLERDAQNRVTKRTDLIGSNQLEYDVAGRVKKVVDGRNLVTEYTYDGFGQLLQRKSPDSGLTTFSYDSYGRLGGVYRPNGSYVSYTYDSFGRITAIGSGFEVVTVTYDSCLNGLGRICSVSDNSGSTSYAYTPDGLIASQTNVIGGTSYTTSFSYDGARRLSGITYPDGKSASYSFLRGNVRDVNVNLGSGPIALATAMRYQPFGALASFTYGNGLQRTLNYDSDGRLTSISSTTPSLVQSLALGWDSNDRVISVTNGRSAALNQGYGYDMRDRLTSVTGAGASSMVYDAADNRTSLTQGGVTTSYVYGNSTPSLDSNRLISASTGGSTRGWVYDNTGNGQGFTGADGQPVGLSYDGFGNVSSSSRLSVATSYVTDFMGQRVSKSGPAGTTRFIYGLNGELLAELNLSTGWTNYVYANAELLGVMRGGSLYFVHNDQLGRPEVVTNAAKATVWSASNLAFGRTASPGAFGDLNIGFPGQYYDVETLTWYNRFRYYDASTGRYVQTDPLGLDGGLNTYAYVGGNPVGLIDPFGLKTCKCTVTFTAVGPNQATAPAGALGTRPPAGSVAFSPGSFGLPFPKALKQRVATQRRIANEGSGITIEAPGLAGALEGRVSFTGTTFKLGDIGDRNIRNSTSTRMDIYGFSSQKDALAFGRQADVSVTIKGVPDAWDCPP